MHIPLAFLIAKYGYFIIFIGGVVEGEMVLIFGGLAAHERILSLPLVITFAFLGALVSDFTFFYLGRRHGRGILLRWPHIDKYTKRPQELIHKHALWVTFAMRFLYGFRNIVPFTLGMSEMRASVFLALNTCGAALWAVLVGTGGFFFGTILEVFIGRVRQYEFKIIFYTLIVFALFHFGYKLFKFITTRISEN
ncbi:MAG: DedA family protein [Candidatus Paceibacterota bacterium]|jgi:membrane protein DedA with SNARE-associated domain